MPVMDVPSTCCDLFGKKYQVAHGDHWVFSNHSDELNACIPYYLHLDEGTGQRKSGVLVFNMQSLWGLDTKTKFERAFRGNLGRSDEDIEDYMTMSQCHNQSGSSFLSRFLYTIIPKKWYSKKFSFVYDKVLEKLAAESRNLASTGVKGWYPICLGVKGDAPALAKAAHFTRSFLNLPNRKGANFFWCYNQIYLSYPIIDAYLYFSRFYFIAWSYLHDHVDSVAVNHISFQPIDVHIHLQIHTYHIYIYIYSWSLVLCCLPSLATAKESF